MKKILTTLCLFGALIASAQTDILDARQNYGVGSDVTVTGIVTNGASLGTVRYIQDATGAIAIYPGTDWGTFTVPVLGDEITVTGTVTEFSGLMEVGPDLTVVTINSSGNDLPAPTVIVPSDQGELIEGVLVQIDAAMFNDGGTIISGNNTYTYIASGESGVIYVRTDNDLVDALLPAGETTVVGILSQFANNGIGGYQILPRAAEDLIPGSAINFSTPVDQINLTQTSFSLIWNTDAAGDSFVEWGLTTDLGEETYVGDLVTEHEVALTGLAPGTIYFAKVTSAAGEDETSSNIRAYATISESSGDILTYFNSSVDNSVATEEIALNIGADMNDTIAAYILRAEHTLEMAIYNINNDVIVNAINAAEASGVQVRYVGHGANANIGVGDFNAGVPVLMRPDDTGSGMHNKFIVIDADYTDQSFVLTGSTNMTTGQLTEDPNNLIIFQDQSMARGFRLEFNEMWGSDGPESDSANAKFGPDKLNNTPKRYVIDGSDVEVHFSPSDGTTKAIENAILSTDYDMSFALLVFTRDELADAIIEVGQSLFINPVGVLEQVNVSGSEYDALVDAGIEVYTAENVDHQLHHKYCIVDHSEPLSDPTVVTGSHNWSSSAETVNDENTVVVHDARIANLYYQNFKGLLIDAGVGVEEQPDGGNYLVYPNPTNSTLTLQSESGKVMNGDVSIFDLNGRLIESKNMNASFMQFDVSALQAGVYVIQLRQSTGVSTVQFMVQ